MKLEEDVRSVTYLKNRAADLLEQVNTTRRHVVITQNGSARGVLLDPLSFQQMRDAIGLLKLAAQGEEHVRQGRVVEHSAVFDGLRAKLTDGGGAG